MLKKAFDNVQNREMKNESGSVLCLKERMFKYGGC